VVWRKASSAESTPMWNCVPSIQPRDHIGILLSLPFPAEGRTIHLHRIGSLWSFSARLSGQVPPSSPSREFPCSQDVPRSQNIPEVRATSLSLRLEECRPRGVWKIYTYAYSTCCSNWHESSERLHTNPSHKYARRAFGRPSVSDTSLSHPLPIACIPSLHIGSPCEIVCSAVYRASASCSQSLSS
jgi:hypothetical protein